MAGDSLKMVMLIHHNPRRKTEAVAAVLVDRVLGLYALLLLATIASLLLPAEQLARLSQRGSRTHKHLPSPNPKSQIKARFRTSQPAPDLKWPGGRAGS